LQSAAVIHTSDGGDVFNIAPLKEMKPMAGKTIIDAGPQIVPAPHEGVLRRRIMAFAVDYVVIAIAVVIMALVIGVVGILTFGLAWLLYAILVPLVAIPYFAMTLGGRDQATPGMKALGLRIVKDDGGRVDWLIATVHVVLFWVFNAVLTPFVLLIALFTKRKRTLHDILLSTSMERA
jgi:uncharacterized RDD family membrane protein YckC